MWEERVRSEYSRARREKDRHYDGKFFFGVTTTGIFCRPSCPAPVAKEENVVYFDNAFAALERGFRPCLRCRPDVELDWFRGAVTGASVVDSALRFIRDGFLNDRSLAELAAELNVSERHLRALFVEHLGAPPVKIARYHKALFAKKLLLSSNRSVADIAFASGFGSIRQCNEAFKTLFGATPTELRRRVGRVENLGRVGIADNTTLLLRYERPLDFARMLDFLRPRALRGVELVTADSYGRAFRTRDARGYFTVRDNPSASALELAIVCDNIGCFMETHNRVRRMFDLDADLTVINERLARDELLLRGMDQGSAPRLPVAFDPFEFTIRAILGQQVSVQAATTMAGRIAAAAAIHTGAGFPEGLDLFFPTADELAALDLEGLGMTRSRRETIRAATRAVLDKTVSLSPNQNFEAFHASFTALKGVGDWTANYVAMRGLGMIDAFPASDLGVIKAMTRDGRKPSVKEILQRSEPWRPYRAYAALCLWNSLKEQ